MRKISIRKLGAAVHEFTSEDEETVLVALAPGEYTLHEQEPPEGYLAAEDIAFTVVDHETVKVDGAEVDSAVRLHSRCCSRALTSGATVGVTVELKKQ